jgi:hypothetical protein
LRSPTRICRASLAEHADVGGLERQLRNDGDAVIALLPVQRDVVVAELLEALERKRVVRTFGLLQAQDVGLHRLQQVGDQFDAQADGIDIPGGEGETHEGIEWAPLSFPCGRDRSTARGRTG